MSCNDDLKRVNTLPAIVTIADDDIMHIFDSNEVDVNSQDKSLTMLQLKNDYLDIDSLDSRITQNESDISDNQSDISDLQTDKADKSNVLELDNTTPFTPDADYEPATKKYVDDATSGGVFTRRYIDGFLVTYNSASLLDFGNGQCRDADNTFNMNTSTEYTKDITSNWVTGDSAGGMPATVDKTGTFTTSGTAVTGVGTSFDTEFKVGDVLWSDDIAAGRRITVITDSTNMTIESAFSPDISVADDVKKNGLVPKGSYYCFVLTNSGGSSYDYGFDTQPNAENLLADSAVVSASYIKYRMVNAIRTDASSNIIEFVNFQKAYNASYMGYVDPIEDHNYATTKSYGLDIMSIPIGLNILGDFTMRVKGGDSVGERANGGMADYFRNSSESQQNRSSDFNWEIVNKELWTNISGEINTIVYERDTSTNIYFYTNGYTIFR